MISPGKPPGQAYRLRWRWIMAAGALIVLAASVRPLARRTLAHKGHGTEEVGEYDLDAPRTVSPETAKHMGLRTEEIGIKPVEEVIEISGVVKPSPDLHRMVVSRVSGMVLSVFKKIGDPVKQGELVARIDSPEFARNLYEVRKLEVEYQRLLLGIDRSNANEERLRAEIEAAQAQSDYAQAELARAQSLLNEGVARKELAQRKADAASAKGDLRLRKIALALAGKEAKRLEKQAGALRLSRKALLVMNNIDPKGEVGSGLTGVLDIKAAADGVVIRRSTVIGQWVKAGETLIEVVDYSVVQVEGEIPESLIARIRARKTNKVRVRTPSDPSYLGEGTIRHIAPQLDPVKRTAHLIVDVKNPKGVLRGEMWVDLSVVLREVKSAVVTPRSSVIVHGPMHFVFVLNGEQYEKQDIVPGVSDDKFVEVKDGLAPGDIVVVQGAYSLTQIRPGAGKKAKSEPSKSPSRSDGDNK